MDDPINAADPTGMFSIKNFVKGLFGLKKGTDEAYDDMDKDRQRRKDNSDKWKELTNEGKGSVSDVLDRLEGSGEKTAKAMRGAAGKIARPGIKIIKSTIPSR